MCQFLWLLAIPLNLALLADVSCLFSPAADCLGIWSSWKSLAGRGRGCALEDGFGLTKRYLLNFGNPHFFGFYGFIEGSKAKWPWHHQAKLPKLAKMLLYGVMRSERIFCDDQGGLSWHIMAFWCLTFDLNMKRSLSVTWWIYSPLVKPSKETRPIHSWSTHLLEIHILHIPKTEITIPAPKVLRERSSFTRPRCDEARAEGHHHPTLCPWLPGEAPHVAPGLGRDDEGEDCSAGGKSKIYWVIGHDVFFSWSLSRFTLRVYWRFPFRAYVWRFFLLP